MHNMNPPQDAVPQQVTVRHIDMGGWLRFFADPQSSGHPDLAAYLSYTATQWFRSRPQFRLRFIVPVCKGGNTAELHVWYEQQLFPDVSGVQTQPAPTRPT
jgi:hypothetical protein